jgi:putative ABC transport system permease protein
MLRLPFGRWRTRRPDDAEIARELRDHLELEEEAQAARGLGADASAAARRRFGSVSYAQESVHEVWRWAWAEQMGQDVRHALRGLLRNPVYALTATITLALGIGATTAVFSLADPIFYRPFPLLPQKDLLWIVQRSQQCPTCDDASPAAFLALRARARSMSAVAATTQWRTSLRRASGSEMADGYLVSANLFSMIAAPFALGHGFASDADTPGHDGVVVLSYSYWKDAFGGRKSIIDSTITLSGKAHRVVGVLARNLIFPTSADVYAPLVVTASDANDQRSRDLTLFARFASDATLAQALHDGATISAQLADEAPAAAGGWTLVPRPLAEFHTDDVRLMFAILGTAVALVLLAACVSVANLALARSAARGRELALRAALGGRRGRLARHLLAESMMVALAGGAIGLALAVWGVRTIRDSIPASMSSFVPGWATAHVDERALVFTLVISIGTTLVFALLPTLRATNVPLSRVLSDGGRGSVGDTHGTRLRATLVVAEVSVALVLLTGATLLARSVNNMLGGDPGVRTDHVLTMQLSVPAATSESGVRDFVRRLDERLRATSGVRAAGLTSTVPLSNSWWGTDFDIPGRAPPRPGEQLVAGNQLVTPDYFRAMGIRLLSGRGIDRADDEGTQRVAVINHYMSEQLWPGTDAVGQVIVIDSIPWTIVGIASDVRHGGFDEPIRYEIDRPLAQAITHTSSLVVWTDGDPGRMADATRGAVAALDPTAAVGHAMTMRDIEARHVSPYKLMARLLTVFAAVTMVIAIVGLYGVIAYGVVQRTREIGVRLALGAQARDILSNVAGGALRLTAVGILIGGAGAFAFAQLLRTLLYRVTANDPTTPLLLAAALLGIALIAALIPAARAMRTDPSVALRE